MGTRDSGYHENREHQRQEDLGTLRGLQEAGYPSALSIYARGCWLSSLWLLRAGARAPGARKRSQQGGCEEAGRSGHTGITWSSSMSGAWHAAPRASLLVMLQV